MTLRVMIVDDEPLARENVRIMLEHRPGVQVVAEACDVQSARECLLRCEVDLVFLDIRMPGASGLELAAGLRVHEAGSHMMTGFPFIRPE